MLERGSSSSRRRDLKRPLTPPPPNLDGEEDEGPEWNILQVTRLED